MKSGIYIYPWDVLDEGSDVIAGYMSDAGITAASVATSYHAGKFLRPHGRSAKVFYPEDGTVYFGFDPQRYGRLRPRLASVAVGFNAVAALADASPDLHLSGWTVGLHNSRLGRENPDVVCRTAFGDPIWSSLCPAHPEARSYLKALCVDQGVNCPLGDIVIEAPGYQTYRHNDHHEFELIQLTPRAMSLLGLCFCPSCRLSAGEDGIDMDRTAARAREELSRFFSAGDAGEPDLIDDPEWQPLLSWRNRLVTQLIADIRSALPDTVTLSVIPTIRTPVEDCWREGAALAALAEAADRVVLPIYQRGAKATAREIRSVRRLAGPKAAIGIILRPSWPTLETGSDLRHAVDAAGEIAATTVDFYNFGHLRLSALDLIKALET